MSEKRIKVVWLCHFSNERIHNNLILKDNLIVSILRYLFRKPLNSQVNDFAIWITNGIQEIEKINNIELHVISPYPHLKPHIQEFENKGVHYHFFRNNDERIKRAFQRQRFKSYSKNRRIITRLINSIKPDIVHLFGAENPYYALAFLDLSSHITSVAQLQTLLSDPDFDKTDDASNAGFVFRAEVERNIINKATYIGTISEKYRQIIKTTINPKASFIDTSLALDEPIHVEVVKKEYDFVYFAASISKAADLAIEAFAIAHQSFPSISLDIVGGYSNDFKGQLDARIKELGISECITFEGSLPTHESVLSQIRKSRFALLPLRVDLVSGTIREAMANGLPVVTTDTGELGTQTLNNNQKTVLLSPIGDHQALADNMMTLLSDSSLQDSLRQNGLIKARTRKSNAEVVREYIDVYQKCMSD